MHCVILGESRLSGTPALTADQLIILSTLPTPPAYTDKPPPSYEESQIANSVV